MERAWRSFAMSRSTLQYSKYDTDWASCVGFVLITHDPDAATLNYYYFAENNKQWVSQFTKNTDGGFPDGKNYFSSAQFSSVYLKKHWIDIVQVLCLLVLMTIPMMTRIQWWETMIHPHSHTCTWWVYTVTRTGTGTVDCWHFWHVKSYVLNIWTNKSLTLLTSQIYCAKSSQNDELNATWYFNETFWSCEWDCVHWCINVYMFYFSKSPRSIW